MKKVLCLALALGLLLTGCGAPQNSATEPATKTSESTTPETKPADGPESTTSTSPASVPTSQPSTAPESAPAPAAQTGSTESARTATEYATITKAEFDQIKNGMTYDEVKKIIGGEGELLAEVGTPGDSLHNVTYMYKGEGEIGANANFAFQGGKLQGKGQMGLK